MGKTKEVIVDNIEPKEQDSKLKKNKKEPKNNDIVEDKPKIKEPKLKTKEPKVKKEPKSENKAKNLSEEKDLVIEVKLDESKCKTKKNKKDSTNLNTDENISKKDTQKKELINNSDNELEQKENNNNIDNIAPKISAITNPEFINLKNKWYELTKKIETLNNERDILEIEKNNFVSEMCKIIEKFQPKIDNLLEQKSTNVNKTTISSKLLDLEDDSDESDSSDSEDEIPIKKKIISKKTLIESSDDDSDSD